MKHFRGNGREFGKRGLTVDLKPIFGDDPERVKDAKAKALDGALRTLKRRLVQEGVIRDLRRIEYYESKGQLRRKAKAVGIQRALKAKSQSEW